MVRYQGKSNQINNLRSRVRTTTRNENPTGLRTKTSMRTRLKRKLLVYKKGDKLFIDNSAAYALHLTNVRSIMVGSPNLVEMGREALSRFQNSGNIEKLLNLSVMLRVLHPLLKVYASDYPAIQRHKDNHHQRPWA